MSNRPVRVHSMRQALVRSARGTGAQVPALRLPLRHLAELP